VKKDSSGKASAIEVAGGFGVVWNGREARTPARAPLCVPTRALAAAIAAEWGAQSAKIQPHTMPMMQFASTAIDRVPVYREDIVAEVAEYAGTDLLCYRAATPEKLTERQRAAWQPLLDWAGERYDVVFRSTQGVVPIDQPSETQERMTSVVASMDDFTLAGIQTLVGGLGSLVLALAVLEGRLAADIAFELSQIEEDYQAETWGEDTLASERRSRIAQEMQDAEMYLGLLTA